MSLFFLILTNHFQQFLLFGKIFIILNFSDCIVNTCGIENCVRYIGESKERCQLCKMTQLFLKKNKQSAGRKIELQKRRMTRGKKRRTRVQEKNNLNLFFC